MENKYYEENVEKIKEILSNNPKYDMQWIEVASKILSEVKDITVKDISNISADKLGVIYQSLISSAEYKENDEDIVKLTNTILNSNINITQLQIILQANTEGVSYDKLYKLINPDITYTKLNYIARAMIDRNDIFEIMDSIDYDLDDFDSDQIYELMAILKDNLIDKFKDKLSPALSAEMMGLARHALELGAEVEIIDNKEINIFFIKN